MWNPMPHRGLRLFREPWEGSRTLLRWGCGEQARLRPRIDSFREPWEGSRALPRRAPASKLACAHAHVHTGEVFGRVTPRRTKQDLLGFLEALARRYPWQTVH